MALAIALELRLRGAEVTVLSRNRSDAAAYAAAGMLAPQAEKLDAGPMQELCLRSRELYGSWAAKLEALTGLDTGYWASGILNPMYEQPAFAVATAEQATVVRKPEPPFKKSLEEQAPAEWLGPEAIRHRQPGLGSDVVGGWWFPRDAQVDNRRQLVTALQAAVKQTGVDWREGVTVTGIKCEGKREGKRVTAIATNQGNITADQYVLAAGAWSGALLDLPVFPRKGQLLSVQAPVGQGQLYAKQPLNQVLFGDRIYIVPRRDGLIVIGATSEDVEFTPGNTPAGLKQLLTEAIRLYPPLKDFPIVETWWGYRPGTPDELPILGPSELENLAIATGHYRNGILLAPITAQLIADWVLQRKTDPLLPAFRWDRFIV